ncbi:prion-inhibition and propagation-domain-containing protein [Xylariaceae sp. AK1471]|nr:prion-inhibition and propagation-domain-containing protein [Xylariaceae sp. AK1471]
MPQGPLRRFVDPMTVVPERPVVAIIYTCCLVHNTAFWTKTCRHLIMHSLFVAIAMEAFGTVAGALSVAALFNNCVNCFEYIQLGRHFGREYERCQLKLDIAKTRLSRWGQAVAINMDPRFATDEPQGTSFQQVQAILEEIEQLFETLQKASKRYAIGAKQEDLELLQIQDMQPVAQTLHSRLNTIVSQRQKRTNFLKKAAWALYDGKNFDKLVEQMTGFVDDLEKLFPVEGARRTIAETEIEEINEDEPSLKALQSAAADTDSVLSKVIAERLEICGGQNYAKNIQSKEKARVRVGNEWTGAALSSHSAGLAGQTRNGADSVAARGSSAVHIGNSYGGRGIFDG